MFHKYSGTFHSDERQCGQLQLRLSQLQKAWFNFNTNCNDQGKTGFLTSEISLHFMNIYFFSKVL